MTATRGRVVRARCRAQSERRVGLAQSRGVSATGPSIGERAGKLRASARAQARRSSDPGQPRLGAQRRAAMICGSAAVRRKGSLARPGIGGRPQFAPLRPAADLRLAGSRSALRNAARRSDEQMRLRSRRTTCLRSPTRRPSFSPGRANGLPGKSESAPGAPAPRLHARRWQAAHRLSRARLPHASAGEPADRRDRRTRPLPIRSLRLLARSGRWKRRPRAIRRRV